MFAQQRPWTGSSVCICHWNSAEQKYWCFSGTKTTSVFELVYTHIHNKSFKKKKVLWKFWKALFANSVQGLIHHLSDPFPAYRSRLFSFFIFILLLCNFFFQVWFMYVLSLLQVSFPVYTPQFPLLVCLLPWVQLTSIFLMFLPLNV